MIGGKRVLGLIPARGGSKGLPRKNVLPLGGKPLIAWTIEAARASRYLDRIVLSSDDDEIMRVAEQYGCEVPFRRPLALAADDTPGIDPVLHALEELPGFDYVVLLQPTSPLRIVADIDGCVETCAHAVAPACVSVVELDKPVEWMYTRRLDGGLSPVAASGTTAARRQDGQPIYVLNGAVYVIDISVLETQKTLLPDGMIGYVMPKERSPDIDSITDLRLSELMLRERIGHTTL